VILEAAYLQVRPGEQQRFEAAFRQAAPLIASIPGHISHRLQRCIEQPSRYLLLVEWQTLEAHVEEFRNSPQYLQWRALLHHFYDPFPTVEHFETVASS
jgi:heme-degrading monooxygenase HmoA